MTSVPDVAIAFKIFLTIPVTVASAERSFSKLKLIKNYSTLVTDYDRQDEAYRVSFSSL